MLGNRSILVFFKAFFKKQHYIAFLNMIKKYPNFIEDFKRYIFGVGYYPYNIKIELSNQTIQPTLYTYHDMLTVNEVFCRKDYPADEEIEVVVDIGSNIGLSALFFLTINNKSKCYLFEPDNRNVNKLIKNLKNFKNRYKLYEKAVSCKNGVVDFYIEETGRYGGMNSGYDKVVKVDSLCINDVLNDILKKEVKIDILKIDIEGLEQETICSIKDKYLKKIKKIYLESKPKDKIISHLFNQKQYGSVCQLTNKNLI